ncbi:hypothetical protein ACFYKX_10975 [Cytobacillus sp. FJAT-54145]|uniref:Uncharacterized protein n=1 Tax=Cytobacillus spartinae TaxID=3299023 RepID=A0ABW6KAA0_9BACI
MEQNEAITVKCLPCNHEFSYVRTAGDENSRDDYYIQCPNCETGEDVGTSYPQTFEVLKKPVTLKDQVTLFREKMIQFAEEKKQLLELLAEMDEAFDFCGTDIPTLLEDRHFDLMRAALSLLQDHDYAREEHR